MKINPDSPWNPINPCDVTPEEYEKEVVNWIKLVGTNLNDFSINHLKHLSGSGGNYEFDGVAEFSIFQGSKLIVVIECKRYSRPVDREKILSLHSKKQDVGAHKAMIFSTSGFQSGALSYAKDRGIACITFIKDNFCYETRDKLFNHEPPSWVNVNKYSGLFLKKEDKKIVTKSISRDNIEPLDKWLKSNL